MKKITGVIDLTAGKDHAKWELRNFKQDDFDLICNLIDAILGPEKSRAARNDLDKVLKKHYG